MSTSLKDKYPVLVDFCSARHLTVTLETDDLWVAHHADTDECVYIITGEYKDAMAYLQPEGAKTKRKKSPAVPIHDTCANSDCGITKPIPDRIILIFTKPYKGHQLDERIELVDAWRMMLNPTLHQWVPRHDKIMFEQLPTCVQDIVSTAASGLPVLSIKDPISIWYGFKAGDIVRITRVSYELNNTMYRQVK